MTPLFRSLIFVPGNNSRFLEKAKKLPADIVCFDLEDSVPDEEKKNARKQNTKINQNWEYYKIIYYRLTASQSTSKLIQILSNLLIKKPCGSHEDIYRFYLCEGYN